MLEFIDETVCRKTIVIHVYYEVGSAQGGWITAFDMTGIERILKGLYLNFIKDLTIQFSSLVHLQVPINLSMIFDCLSLVHFNKKSGPTLHHFLLSLTIGK